MLKSLLSPGLAVNCPSQETEVTSTPTRPVDNVVIATKGLQDRNINIRAGTTVENKGKLILIDLVLELNIVMITALSEKQRIRNEDPV